MKRLIFQLLIAAYHVVIQNPVYDFAASLPYNDSMYINESLVADLNKDGFPEVYLSAASGWQYCVYYYLDGEVFTLDNLTPWMWSSELCYTADDRLVMAAYSHTTGTAGNIQYRVYEWGTEGYLFVEDLWQFPVAWNEAGEPAEFDYISADRCFDPYTEELDETWKITAAEYEQKVAGFGEMTNVFASAGTEWDMEWWQEHGDVNEIYMMIEKELVDWQL